MLLQPRRSVGIPTSRHTSGRATMTYMAPDMRAWWRVVQDYVVVRGVHHSRLRSPARYGYCFREVVDNLAGLDVQHLPAVGHLGVEFGHGCGLDGLCLVAPLIRSSSGDHAAGFAHLHGRFHEIETIWSVRLKLRMHFLERLSRRFKLDGFNKTNRGTQHIPETTPSRHAAHLGKVSDMTFIAGVPTPSSIYGEIENDFFVVTVGTDGPFATELPWTIGLEIDSLEHPGSAVHVVTEFSQNGRARWTFLRNIDGLELMTFEDVDGVIRNQSEQFIYKFRASQVPLPPGALRVRAWTLPVATPEPQKSFTPWARVYVS